MKKVIKSKSLHRMLCTLLLLCAGVTLAMASSDRYYQANVSVKDNGSGLVYVNNTSSQPNYQPTSSKSGEGTAVTIPFLGTVLPTTDLYLYAQENDGWLFNSWQQKDGNNWSEIGTNNPLTIKELQFSSRNSNSPTTFTYRAVFTEQKGVVKVQVAENGRGTVSINDANNSVGSNVTLTANPDASNGYYFLGWNKDKNDKTNFISTLTPYTFTVTNDNKGTYYAHFSEAPEVMYCRIMNNKTRRYLTLYGNAVAAPHKRNFSAAGQTVTNVADGFIFTNGLKLVDEETAKGNPMTVFQRNGHPAGMGITNHADLIAHNIQYSDLVSEDETTNQYPLTMETQSDGSVRIYTTYTCNIRETPTPLNSYLCDENKSDGWAVMKTLEDLGSDAQGSANWTVYLLDENTTTGSLGANAKSNYSSGDYVYTTMYTYFPYKVLDGVKAYYLPRSEESYNKETKTVSFKMIESGIIPAYTAVVLECPAAYNGQNNRINPLPESAVGESDIIPASYNILKGYISIYDNAKGEVNKVANNKASMYVLSKSDGILGFYHYSKDYMNPNKAYLDLGISEESEEIENLAKTVKFSFDEPETETPGNPTGIKLSNQMVDEDESVPVYNLNGSKVAEGKAAEKMLRPGVYVKKGKKFVVN